jgi:hypothetical protein
VELHFEYAVLAPHSYRLVLDRILREAATMCGWRWTATDRLGQHSPCQDARVLYELPARRAGHLDLLRGMFPDELPILDPLASRHAIDLRNER